MAMAMHSDRAYPSSPMKEGTLPSPLALRCSALGLVVSASTILRSRLLAFATALMAVERGLSCEVSQSAVCDDILQRPSGEGGGAAAAYRGGEESAESHLSGLFS